MATYHQYYIPAEMWKPAEPAGNSSERIPGSVLFCQLLKESLDLWRRIHKGANVEAERGRYLVCIGEIESWLIRNGKIGADADSIRTSIAGGQVVGIALQSRYFDLMAGAFLDQQTSQAQLSQDFFNDDFSDRTTSGPVGKKIPIPTLGCSIFPPGVIAEHIAQVEQLLKKDDVSAEAAEAGKHRQQLLRAAAAVGAGVVEVAEELDNGPALAPGSRRPIVQPTPQNEETPFEPVSKQKRQAMAERLTAEIKQALRTGGKVNMSNQLHEVSTDVLGRFVRRDPNPGEVDQSEIRIIYADGSDAKPFPLRCLAPMVSDAKPAEIKLSIALMSMRHLELDPLVDFAWYRNKEVSQTRALGESDEFCFQYSRRQIADLAAVYGKATISIDMYHTGFEPAVIGFYRAITLTLMRKPGWLRVVPLYYGGGSRFHASEVVWD